MKVVIGCDHAGVKVKTFVSNFFEREGVNYEDFSPLNKEFDDYPDFALDVSKKVASEKSLGVLVCGTGIGMSIVANKVKGVRAALCHTSRDAELARKHNDANILVLSGSSSKKLVENILKKFFSVKFERGRHLRRVNKIRKFEKNE